MKKLDVLARFGWVIMTLLFGVAVFGNVDVKLSNSVLRNELNAKSSEISTVNEKVEQLQMDYASLQLQVQELSK